MLFLSRICLVCNREVGMKFEEVLPLLREGKKAYYPTDKEGGSYFIAGYIGMPDCYDDDGKLVTSEKILTIHEVTKDGLGVVNKNSWGLSRWMLMCDQWEIVSDEI